MAVAAPASGARPCGHKSQPCVFLLPSTGSSVHRQTLRVSGSGMSFSKEMITSKPELASRVSFRAATTSGLAATLSDTLPAGKFVLTIIRALESGCQKPRPRKVIIPSPRCHSSTKPSSSAGGAEDTSVIAGPDCRGVGGCTRTIAPGGAARGGSLIAPSVPDLATRNPIILYRYEGAKAMREAEIRACGTRSHAPPRTARRHEFSPAHAVPS